MRWLKKIMNRVRSKHATATALAPCGCGSNLPQWECELLTPHFDGE